MSHLSTEVLPPNRVPRRITIFLAAPPGDGVRAAREYFHEYIKPVLVSAALDWDVVEGRREGDVRAGLAEKVRKLRIKNGESTTAEAEEDVVEIVRTKLGIKETDDQGGDLIIGRHTWKEYVRGLHEGWLGPIDLPPEPTLEISPEPLPEPLSEPTPESTVESASSTGESPTTIGEPSKEETPKEEIPKEEAPKPKPKPRPTPPYILPASYQLSDAVTVPQHLPTSIVLPFPHLLGFLNTPVRIYRFLNRRHQAEAAGQLVASLVLGESLRPYTHNEAIADEPWEQQQVLQDEEQDWHKTARAPNPPEDEGKERPWMEPMVIDERIGSRMRTLDPVAAPRIESGNSRDWQGGAERPENMSWRTWFMEAIGMEVREVKCKGWEDGLVDGE